MEDKIKHIVKNKYSQIAKNSSSCCKCSCSVDMSEELGYSKDEINSVPEGSNLGLGCGNPTALAQLKEGGTVLDLGSGAGFDVFLAANKVGEKGYVIGVDMTEKMIDKANENAEKGGYRNVEFRLGDIENLPVEDDSIDVIISNCVINLSPNKLKVYQEVYRVLKSGGKIVVSDIVTLKDLPKNVKEDLEKWTSCISGALKKEEYLDVIEKTGFKDIKILSESSYCDERFDEKLRGKITSIQIEAHK